jgi:hypothetical protein
LETKELKGFLEKAISGFEKGDIFALKEAANKAIENASLENNKSLARIALVSYCLHKMSSKQHMVRHERWQAIKKGILSGLRKALADIEQGNMEGFEKHIDGVISSVKKADEKMGYYVQNLFEKARVKYASFAYSMGLGLGQASSLTGANKKHLLRYIGVTRISDREEVTKGIGERLKELKGKMGAKPK